MGVLQEAELLIPLCFQGVGDQAVVRVHAHEPLPGEVDFILCLVDLCAPQCVRLVESRLQLLLDTERDLERQRADRVDDQRAEGGVNRGPGDLLADGLARLDPLALAHIDRNDGLAGVVIAYRHPLAAGPTDHQALQ